MPRIFYIYQRNARDRFVQSGRPFALLKELEKTGWDVEVANVGSRRFETITRCFAVLFRLLGRSYLRDRHPPYLRALSRGVDKAVASASRGDFIFSPSTLPFYHVQGGLPKVFCVDAPFQAMVGYYPDFARLPQWTVRASLAAESRVFAEAGLTIVPSQWAAQALGRNIAVRSLKVLPFGANWGASNTWEYVNTCLQAKLHQRCRILFVGRERYRKGLDLLEQTARLAETRRLPVDFDVVGISQKGWRGKHVQMCYHGILNPNDRDASDRMTRLWERASFFMVPSRAEAFGMSFCEANAFGLPFITLGTGGSHEILRSGRNGLQATEDTIAQTAVDAFQRYSLDESWYCSFCRSSYDEFSQRLNWRVFGEGMRAGLAEAGLLP